VGRFLDCIGVKRKLGGFEFMSTVLKTDMNTIRYNDVCVYIHKVVSLTGFVGPAFGQKFKKCCTVNRDELL
jgi:hypothetical protein